MWQPRTGPRTWHDLSSNNRARYGRGRILRAKAWPNDPSRPALNVLWSLTSSAHREAAGVAMRVFPLLKRRRPGAVRATWYADKFQPKETEYAVPISA